MKRIFLIRLIFSFNLIITRKEKCTDEVSFQPRPPLPPPKLLTHSPWSIQLIRFKRTRIISYFFSPFDFNECQLII